MKRLGGTIHSACEAAASFLGGFVGVRGTGAIGPAPAGVDAHHCGVEHSGSTEEPTPASIRRQLTARAARRRSCC